jgi:hypothetical protein
MASGQRRRAVKECLAVLFAAHFTELADDQFLTALAWGIAALRDADDLRTRAK